MHLTFPFNEVTGLISEADRKDLQYLSNCCVKVPEYYLEIGSLYGASTLCILSGIMGFEPRHTLVSLDINHFEHAPIVEQNIINAGMDPVGVIMVSGDFRNTLPTIHLRTIAFAFVDHDHRLATTRAAYDLIWPRLNSGGILAFHDYDHPEYPEPKEFLDSLKHHRYLCRQGLIAFSKE